VSRGLVTEDLEDAQRSAEVVCRASGGRKAIVYGRAIAKGAVDVLTSATPSSRTSGANDPVRGSGPAVAR
jgi:hypothetical protein